MKPTTLLPTALLLLISRTTATFSLNTSGPYWSYTAQQLAPTTHQKCKVAYSAPIACTETLLGLVTSLRPGFQPTRDDLNSMCTLSCKSALEDYVQNVGSQCGLKGDLATAQAITTGRNDTYLRVWTVGQMFEYTYAQSCAKDQNNNFCPLTSSTLPSSPANCTSACSISFYTNAHDFYPASHRQFLSSYLTTQTPYWIQQFKTGYDALVACGKAIGGGKQSKSNATGVAAANRTVMSSSLAGTASVVSSGGIKGTGATATASVVVQSGRSAGSVVGVEGMMGVGLGVLGLVAAAVLL